MQVSLREPSLYPLIMVNDLDVYDDTVKFADGDTTLWEIIMRDQQPASALITVVNQWLFQLGD
jgi:hypothetical protein